jgi:hypothetical protein
MITIKHGRATFKVNPDYAVLVHDLLATIDKSKSKKGPKLTRPKGDDKHHSGKRDYPRFNPECMLTGDYVTAYIALNHKRLRLVPCTIEPATNRTPPGLDLTTPDPVHEVIE